MATETGPKFATADCRAVSLPLGIHTNPVAVALELAAEYLSSKIIENEKEKERSIFKCYIFMAICEGKLRPILKIVNVTERNSKKMDKIIKTIIS